MSESHILEIWNIGNPRQRSDLARELITLSRRRAIAPLHRIWQEELAWFLHRQFGIGGVPPEPFGKGLAFAFGFTDAEFAPPWPDDAREVDIALTEYMVLAEPDRSGLSQEELRRRNEWTGWSDSAQREFGNLLQERGKYNEQDRIAAATLSMVIQSLVGHVIGKDVHEAFLEYLEEHAPWGLLRELPSVAVLSELFRLRYPNSNKTWTRTDYHDLRFLSVALSYCHGVTADNFWSDLALRSEYIRELGTIIGSGDGAIRRLVETIST